MAFDNISTSAGLAVLPSPYHHLSFTSYNVFRPRDPAFEGYITPHDYNCAVSPPNALLGSRLGSESKPASFQIANSTAMRDEGLSPYFTLESFWLKPMDAPDPGTRVNVTGYRYDEDEELEWYIDFPSGYHLPFLVKMEEYSRQKWGRLRRVEITADFGEQELDWEFCLDDLQLGFHKVDGEGEGTVEKWKEQVILTEKGET
ncbi:MAG: hypothetical protein Q9219_003337 [cf. Caloplaca sp. 3 TL-2023]